MPKVTLKPEYRPKGKAEAAKEKELEPTPKDPVKDPAKA